MDQTFKVHFESGTKIFTEAEIIDTARQIEASGDRPMYSFYDYRTYEPMTPPGWLIWSTWDDGACVVYKTTEGRYRIVTGWQGDFVVS